MTLSARFEEGIDRLSRFALRHSTVQNFFICVTAISFLLWQMSERNEEIKGITSLSVLDARMGYTPPEAYQLLHALGPEGRKKYLQINLYDMVLPLALAALLSIIIGPLYHKAQLWEQVNTFPLIYMGFDLTENILIRYLLLTFPTAAPKIAFVAGELTRYKYRFFYYTLGVVGFGFIAVLRKLILEKLRGRQARAARAHHLE